MLPSQSLQKDRKGRRVVSVNSSVYPSLADQRIEVDQDFIGFVLGIDADVLPQKFVEHFLPGLFDQRRRNRLFGDQSAQDGIESHLCLQRVLLGRVNGAVIVAQAEQFLAAREQNPS